MFDYYVTKAMLQFIRGRISRDELVDRLTVIAHAFAN